MSPNCDVQQVCENGHQVTDCYETNPSQRKQFCEECGAKTIIACPNCGTKIRGAQIGTRQTIFQARTGAHTTRREQPADVPSHCSACGKPYPWTEKGNAPVPGRTTEGETISAEMDVFISHSSHDELIASRLITLIRGALNLPSDRIRCTSVNGYRLPTGVSTDEALRREIHHSKAFVAIITPNSMASPYVLFELGARWGVQKPMLPLLACGASSEQLKGPLSAINALNATDSAQLHQFVADLARVLQRELDHSAAYQKCINEIIQVATKGK